MSISAHFDVLVVYSSLLATSASSKKEGGSTPFSLSAGQQDFDAAYAYFLETCKKNHLKAAFTTSADIIGSGRCRSYWQYEKSGWIKVKRLASAEVIFDKCSPVNERERQRRELLFSSPRIRPFNEPWLYQLFFDKQMTYSFFTDTAIPTVSIANTTPAGLLTSVSELNKIVDSHEHRADFTHQFVLKDRHGYAGNNVHLIQGVEEMATIVQSNPHVEFVLQPLLRFDQGYCYKKMPGRTEIRLIFMGGEIVQAYIRIALGNEFRCSESQGGTSIYIKISDVPDEVLRMAYLMVGKLPQYDSLYALDFVVSNDGNPYLLEGNTGPGLNWVVGKKVDERKSHQLIQMIVSELTKRAERHASPMNYIHQSWSPAVFA